MTTRKHLDKLIQQLAERGVQVHEDEDRKRVRFTMRAQDLVTFPDKKLRRLMEASVKVENIFTSLGYAVEVDGRQTPPERTHV